MISIRSAARAALVASLVTPPSLAHSIASIAIQDGPAREKAPGQAAHGDATAKGSTREDSKLTAAGKEAVRARFLANCATCHGESGDGKGTTKLEKPARSFKDGGFSYGNTPEALLRTITNGIPGTPMPSFASALKEPERKELAEYVLSLGPPVAQVSEAETIMTVPRDRPVFIRGKLPPIAEGLEERPRGLLVGTSDGFTFEYRADEVRLLGVRQGAFVERMDWRDRGGVPLKPLGKLVYLFGDGNPGPSYSLVEADTGARAALSARLSATYSSQGRAAPDFATRATVAYILWSDTKPLRTRVAWVEESPRAYPSSIGSGFVRSIQFENLSDGGRFSLCASVAKGSKTVAAARDAWTKSSDHPGSGPMSGETQDWIVRSRSDGQFEVLLAGGLNDPNGKRDEALVVRDDEVDVDFAPNPHESRSIRVVTVIAPKWDDEVRAKWIAELKK
jgi:mono/diheme cytochrome c family protein